MFFECVPSVVRLVAEFVFCGTLARRLLERKNSPLLGMLMECLRVLLKEYKSEIEEMLVADKQLQREIMYDMQKHEEAKARVKVAAAAAVVMASVPVAEVAAAAEETKPGVMRDVTPSESHRVASAVVAGRTPTIHEEKPGLHQGADEEDKENNGGLSCAQKGATPTPTPGGKNVEFSTSRTLRSSTARSRAAPLPRPAAGSTEKSGAAQPSPRVTWLDQTPGYLVNNSSSASAARECLPKRLVMTTPIPCMKAPPGLPSSSTSSPFLKKPPTPQLAGAVADVAAAATAAAVLKEVASNSAATPLKSMSVPKVRTRTPPLMSADSRSGERSVGSRHRPPQAPQPQSSCTRTLRSRQQQRT